MKRFTVSNFLKYKSENKKITVTTAYDRFTAQLAEQANVDAVLVGDSLGMVVLGYEDTLSVIMEDMISHGAAVKRCNKSSLIIVDMPFMSYQTSIENAVYNAGRLVKETGCTAVKLEGGVEYLETIAAIVKAGIPVMGHIGYTPQSINVFGGHKSQGKDEATAKKVIEDAVAVQDAGAFAVTLECVPHKIAEIVTQTLQIPTIGIGSGAGCDGQVLVAHDLLGFYNDFNPRHVKKYLNAEKFMIEAYEGYVSDVREGAFPTEKNSFEATKGAVEMATNTAKAIINKVEK